MTPFEVFSLSALEKLREDLAKVCDENAWPGSIVHPSILAAAIRSHDLTPYASSNQLGRLTVEQVEAHRKENIIVLGEPNEPWAIEENRILNALCDAYLATPYASPVEDEEVAERFHEVYERLAPRFGYETREDTKVFDPESPNGKLMIAVCNQVLARQAAELREAKANNQRIQDLHTVLMKAADDRNDALEAELREVRKAIKKYGRHTLSCMRLDYYDERDHGCTCGFEVLIRGKNGD